MCQEHFLCLQFYGDGVERLESALQAELTRLVQSVEARVEGSVSRDAIEKTCQLEMHSFYSRSLQRILTAVVGNLSVFCFYTFSLSFFLSFFPPNFSCPLCEYAKDDEAHFVFYCL